MIKGFHNQVMMKLLGLCLVLTVFTSLALTSANTVINNQATATYVDAASAARTVSSNTVKTIVQQVAALTLTSDQSKPGSASAIISFPHVVTNTGNGVDTYNLVAANLTGDDYNFTAIRILPDADGNGIPDSISTIAQTPALDSGEHYTFVVEADVPGGATDTQVGSFTVTASSAFDAGQSVVNTDTVTVTDRAIIDLTKSLSASSGLAGSGTYRVNLIYNNPSNKIATDVTIIDVLPSEMVYVGNATWSIGSLSLTDANENVQGSAPAIIYCAYDATCTNAPFSNNQVTLVIDEVGAGQSGTVSFDVSIAVSAVPSLIFNTANYQYNDTVAVTSLADSNPAPFEILPTAAVDIVGQTAPNSQPGQTVSFTNTVTNNGNAIDTFNITLNTGSTNFPVATVYTLYMADGFTPLTDTNADGLVDTGPVAPGATAQVILKAIIPPTAAANTYSINKIATSQNNPTVSDTDADTVTITLSVLSVDLTNDFARGHANCDAVADACGYGPGPSASSQATVAVLPESAGTFVLYANNTSTVSDSFDLSVSTDPSFSVVSLPAGWVVTYIDDANQAISNTGPLAPNDSMRIRAIVSVPAGHVAGSQPIYFRLQSPVTGSQDVKFDDVDVQVIEDLQLGPDNTGQTTPGSVIGYAHTLFNNGNEDEDNIQLTAVNSLAANGWTVLIYEDTNGSGVYDTGDAVISSVASLAPGASKLLFTRVFVPTSAAQGTANVTTLTASYNAGSASLIDRDTTVANKYNVDVVKTQALDTDCDGEADGGLPSFTQSSFAVSPGQCVVYQIDTQNNSSETVQNVQVYDGTPPYTIYSTNQPAVRCTPGVAPNGVCIFVTEPAVAGSGPIHAQTGSLNSGQSIQLYFNVELEQ